MNSTTLIDEDALKIVEDIIYERKRLRDHEFTGLCEKSERVHASYIFYRDNIEGDPISQLCSEIYVMLVRRIGATRQEGQTPGWKELGCQLGLLAEEIYYIDNSKRSCPTDMVLRVFTQSEDATFGKVLKALLTLGRSDAIEGIFEPLNKLIGDLSYKNKQEQDQGYYSNTSKERGLDIIKPRFVINDVPEVLQWNRKKTIIEKSKDNDSPNEENCFQKNDFHENNDLVSGPSVLLTYSEDAVNIAQDVFHKISNFDNGTAKINVICLENIKSKVLTNPEQYIRNYFEEVDYVIPIITEKYIDVIKSPSNAFGSSLENVDCKHVRFIYTLMSTHFINGTGCMNMKIRAVLSQNVNKKVLNQLCMYPLLSVWTWESELEKLLTALFLNK